MGNEIFEEIKRKYKKSNKYMLYVSYEDIGNLIQMVEMLDKQIKELVQENREIREWKYVIDNPIDLVNRSAGKTFQQAVRNEVIKVLQSLLEN